MVPPPPWSTFPSSAICHCTPLSAHIRRNAATVSAEASLKGTGVKEVYEYDIPTEAGKSYTVSRARN